MVSKVVVPLWPASSDYPEVSKTGAPQPPSHVLGPLTMWAKSPLAGAARERCSRRWGRESVWLGEKGKRSHWQRVCFQHRKAMEILFSLPFCGEFPILKYEARQLSKAVSSGRFPHQPHHCLWNHEAAFQALNNCNRKKCLGKAPVPK